MTAYTSGMSNHPASPASPASPAGRPASPAVALLSTVLGPPCMVSTLPAPAIGDEAGTPGEPAVCVGWRAAPSAEAPGLVPTPILVCPMTWAGTGEYVVSYRQTAVVSVLLDLPETVRGLMDMAQGGKYQPRR